VRIRQNNRQQDGGDEVVSTQGAVSMAWDAAPPALPCL